MYTGTEGVQLLFSGFSLKTHPTPLNKYNFFNHLQNKPDEKIKIKEIRSIDYF
jgi:hypothetical protein